MIILSIEQVLATDGNVSYTVEQELFVGVPTRRPSGHTYTCKSSW